MTSHSGAEVRLMWGFSTHGLTAQGKDRGGDGKHKANLQDLNYGFRFPPQGAGAVYVSAVQPAVV